MKCSIFLATIACVLSAAMAVDKVGMVQSQLMSYVQENLGDIRMMRGSTAQLSCYDQFIPLINGLADKAKQNSQACVNTADSAKESALAKLKDARAELSAQVKKIQDSLTECAGKPDGLGYFECLIGLVDEDKQILDTIGSRSKNLVSQYGEKIREVDQDEQTCLRNAIDEAKEKTDNAFVDLKTCIAQN